MIKTREDYYNEHKRCPNCGSTKLDRTLIGFIFDPNHPEIYKDTNTCECICGWKGNVDKLISEQDKSRKELQAWLLDEIDLLIKTEGENAIFCQAPKTGKNSWTIKEYRNAVENDTTMDEYYINPIDEFIAYLKFCKNNGNNFDFKHRGELQ